jgi:hypothetical protein
MRKAIPAFWSNSLPSASQSDAVHISEIPAPSRNPFANRFLGYTDDCPNFLVGKPFDEVERHTDPSSLRNLQKGFFQGHFLNELIGEGAHVGGVGRFGACEWNERQQTPSAVILVRVVGGYSIEPRLQGKIGTSFEDTSKRLKEGILRQILSDFIVPGHPQKIANDRPLIVLNDFAESVVTASADLSNNLRLVQQTGLLYCTSLTNKMFGESQTGHMVSNWQIFAQ